MQCANSEQSVLECIELALALLKKRPFNGKTNAVRDGFGYTTNAEPKILPQVR
jgi:hypothetical protein